MSWGAENESDIKLLNNEMGIGIYPNLSNEAYHAHDSISRSKLMDASVSMYNYWALHLNPDRPAKKVTDAMILGTAFHTLCLEFDKFADLYAIEPEKVLLKDVGKDRYAAFKAEVEALEKTSKIVLSRNDFQTLHNMKAELFIHPQAKELIQNATYEQSYFWKDKESGLVVKARPDILHQNMIVDLKTCSDASPRAFQASMAKGGYHIQGAMVQDAVMALEGRYIETVINICIETKYPYAIGIYIIDEEALEAGRSEYKALLSDLNRCIRNNCWSGLEPQNIGLPRWADR